MSVRTPLREPADPGRSATGIPACSVHIAAEPLDPLVALQRELATARQLQRDNIESSPTALIWSCRECLVVSARDAHRPGHDVAARDLRRRGWPVHIRQSGGSVVPQGPGSVNLTLVWLVPRGERPSITRNYLRLCETVQSALAQLRVVSSIGPLPGSFCDGRFNLLLSGRKFAGTAQRWIMGRGDQLPGVIAHAVLLAEPLEENAIDAVARYQSLTGSEEPFDPGTCISLAEHAGETRLPIGPGCAKKALVGALARKLRMDRVLRVERE